VYAVDATTQAGTYRPNGLIPARAVLWNLGPEPSATLSPLSLTSTIYGMDGPKLAGEVAGRAVMWNGTPESMVHLHNNTEFSEALAVRGNMQVGWASGKAALWQGSPGTYVNLEPPG
jgi:hypothetical protein